MILYILYPLSALVMIGLPVALGIILARKTRAPWSLFGVGLMTFIGSQVVHLPLLAGLTMLFKSIWPSAQPQPWHIPFNAVLLGLLAGLCEETARYIGYRWLVPRARAFRDALMLGVGHGGIEAIILGLLGGLTFFTMLNLRRQDPSLWGISGPNLQLAQAQVSAYWNSPWYLALLSAVERVFALMLHLSLSVMVLQVFTRRNWGWLGLAIGYHAFVDAVAVFGAQSGWPALILEAAVGLMALAGLALVWILRPRGHGLVPSEPAPILVSGASQAAPSPARQARRTQEQIDDSRYT